ncbi:MAG: hypothetical protein KDK36_06020 [Leptospiraceae bacterium]|nr:hypothetical protein [Leptospiraceae bacterium]
MFSLPFIFYIPTLFNRHFYRDLILENVNNFTNYFLFIEELNLAVYPRINLEVKNISLLGKRENIEYLKLKEIDLKLHYLALLTGSRLNLKKLELREGYIDLPALINSLPEKKEEKKENSDVDITEILEKIDTWVYLKGIRLYKFKIIISDLDNSIKYDPYINNMNFTFDTFSDISLFLDLVYGKTNLNSRFNLGIPYDDLNINSSSIKSVIRIKNFPIYEYSNYLGSVPNLKFSESNINLELEIKKQNNLKDIDIDMDLVLTHLGYINKKKHHKRISNIALKGNLNYPLESKRIKTKNLEVHLPGVYHLKLDSEMSFEGLPIIRARMNSNLINLNEVLDLAGSFSAGKKEESSKSKKENAKKQNLRIYLDLNYNINMLAYEGYIFRNLYIKTLLKNTSLNYSLGTNYLSGGFLHVTGEADLKDGISLNSNIEIDKIDMENFTQTYLKKKMAEGMFSSLIKLHIENRTGGNDFVKNLTLTGHSTLKDGILLDKADILYPVRLLNKIIPTEEKLNSNISRFEKIDMDYSIKNGRLKMNHLEMLGKIFNANGSADVGLDNPSEDIKANLVVSTSVAGAGLKIPLVYEKSSYVPFRIDRVWLASVYTGMVMGGPMGAMIGSVLSDKAGAAFSTITEKSKENIENSTNLIMDTVK